jgi:hypothetical protein
MENNETKSIMGRNEIMKKGKNGLLGCNTLYLSSYSWIFVLHSLVEPPPLYLLS